MLLFVAEVAVTVVAQSVVVAAAVAFAVVAADALSTPQGRSHSIHIRVAGPVTECAL